jgi:serine/threonine-protein kinase
VHLDTGAAVGRYEIVSPLGAGGMGEVYRARDVRLQRDVALKILPEMFARDHDRLARFEREAQVLASLNHPNIAQIYGVEDAGPVPALVMEYVDGPTLADLLPVYTEPSSDAGRPASHSGTQRAVQPLTVRDALEIARQIADALEAAHERGIIHRDLKPANLKVRPDGTVKVLDFGLAKALDPVTGPGAALPNSPTITSPAIVTGAGVILGTAAYMSPEQARGRTVDRRADLWAFGVVLYEMLSGRAAFPGDTVTDVLAAIVRQDPDWSALPADTPPAIRRLLRRCLERDVRKRIADAGEVKFQIDEVLNPSLEEAGAVTTAIPPIGAPIGRTRSRMATFIPWTVALVLGIVAAILAWAVAREPDAPVARYSIEAPANTTLSIVSRPGLAVSPDGRTIALAAESGGVTRIYLRRQEDFAPRMLAGTENGSHPVFSPDGRWLAFVAGTRLNKIPVDGGPVITLAAVSDPRGLSWDSDDLLTFTPDATGGIYRVSARGGPPVPVTKLDEAKSERTHRWGQMLPGARAILFTVGTQANPDSYDSANVEAQVLATGERKLLVSGASMARYLPTGHLVFARQRVLYAADFDLEDLEILGTPVPIVQGVAGDATTGAVHADFSRSGTLAYFPGSTEGTQHFLTWVNAAGSAEALNLPPGTYYDPRLSPDGAHLAVVVASGGGSDIWVHNLVRRSFTRLTFGGMHVSPVWSADSRMVYYSALSANGQSVTIMRRPADGSRDAEALTTHSQRIYLHQIAPDGRAIVDLRTPLRQSDIGLLRLERNAKPEVLIATPADELAAELSPDGRWLAYQSNESGQMEVYVRSVAIEGGRWQVSSKSGEEPRWSPDGGMLYFRTETQLMAAPIERGQTFQFGTPRRLFSGMYDLRTETGITYDVDPRENRFLTLKLAEESVSLNHIRLITNWFTELRGLVDTR